MGKRVIGVLVALSAAGCGASSSAVIPPDQPASVASTAFDPARCGRITGRVAWEGTAPEAPQQVFAAPTSAGSFELKPMPNPNRLHVGPRSNGVAGAVVFLRGVDIAKAKPWDLPPVRVEMRDLQIVVKQGDGAPGRTGFVRRGNAVEMKSAEERFHVLRGRGAGYFSLAFPDAEKPLCRTFDQPGRVELWSGAGYYWASADLFVDDHPYYVVTDGEGRFAFEQVPAGDVSVVAWHPHWNAAKQERNPETGLVTRQTYAPPLEVASPARVESGRTATTELRLR